MTFLILFCLSVQYAYAISIRPPIIEINFDPYYKESFVFRTSGAENIEIYKKGDLTEYVTINQTSFKNSGTFLVTISFPEKMDKPGKHRIIIGARELSGGGGMLSAVAAIQAPIYVMVPYEGKYIEAFFSVSDTNINELTYFTVKINNLGTENITKTSATVRTYKHLSNNTIDTFHSEVKELPTKSSVTFKIPFDTTTYKAGYYKAIADIYYDEDNTSKGNNFKIGELTVKINSYPRLLYNGTINKFPIELESGWNNKIKDVYAEIDIKTRSGLPIIDTLKTHSIDLPPWEKEVIQAYIDATNVYEGEYNLTIRLHYEGKTTVKEDTILIVEKETKKALKLSALNISLLAMIALLIILNVIRFIIKKRKNRLNSKKKRK